jgi:hypothetical protein
MKRNRLWIFGLSALLVGVASTAWGAFDSPDGEPPFGIDFEDGRSGQQFEGVVTMIFRAYNDLDLSAAGFDAVARLRKGGELHAFYARYDCATLDPCALCTGGRLDVTQIPAIQLCLQDEIEPEVVSDFGLAGADVRLKNMSSFVSEIDPDDVSVRAVAADIDVTAK